MDRYAVKIGDSPEKLKIKLLVEDMDGADSYRYAAAEVIRTQFSDKLAVDPAAELVLWIYGTKGGLEIRPGIDIQDIEVAVETHVPHPLTAGQKTRTLFGSFRLATDGGVAKGYTGEQKAQKVRELTYKVVSEFLEKWQQAPK